MALKRGRKDGPKASGAFQGVLGGLLLKGVELLGLGGQALSSLAHSAEKKVNAAAMRLGMMLVLLLWVSAGVLLALLGLFFLLIDQAAVPRGMVFGAGGVLVSLVSLLLLKFSRERTEDLL